MNNLGIEVLGQLELEGRIDEPHYSHLISIGNPKSLFTINRPDTRMPPIFRKRFARILRLSFYDAEKRSHLHRRQFPKTIPSKYHIRKAIRFFHATKDSTNGYTIHCWQGISRSSAYALGLLYLITGSEDLSLMILRNIRPDAHPNSLIIKLFDEELRSNLSRVNNILHQKWIEKTKKELNLTPDGLLEELQPVD
jgi:predicted protein tyrosine phosphatase